MLERCLWAQAHLCRALPACLLTSLVLLGSGCPGLCTVDVPELAGLEQGAAQAALSAAGLRAGQITLSYHPDVLDETVIKQAPASGKPVPFGAEVDLLVSRGPYPAAGAAKWAKLFGVCETPPSTSTEEACAVLQTYDGGYLTFSRRNDVLGSGPGQRVLRRLDSSGGFVWDQTHDSSGIAAARALDGGYVVLDDHWDDAFGSVAKANRVRRVVKVDALGHEAWIRDLAGHDVGGLNDVRQTLEGGYIVAGFAAAPTDEAVLVKLDADGHIEWRAAYGATAPSEGVRVEVLPGGDYALAGYAVVEGVPRLLLMRTDAAGVALWTQYCTPPGVLDTQRAKLALTAGSEGGFLLAGTINPQNPDVYMVKTSANGEVLWSGVFGGEGSDWCCAAATSGDGGYVVAGGTTSTDWAGGAGMCFFKVTAQGDLAWVRSYDGDGARAMRATLDGGYVLAGTYTPSGASCSRVYVVKTDEAGNGPGELPVLRKAQ